MKKFLRNLFTFTIKDIWFLIGYLIIFSSILLFENPILFSVEYFAQILLIVIASLIFRYAPEPKNNRPIKPTDLINAGFSYVKDTTYCIDINDSQYIIEETYLIRNNKPVYVIGIDHFFTKGDNVTYFLWNMKTVKDLKQLMTILNNSNY